MRVNIDGIGDDDKVLVSLGTRGMCSSERFGCIRVATWYILGY